MKLIGPARLLLLLFGRLFQSWRPELAFHCCSADNLTIGCVTSRRRHRRQQYKKRRQASRHKEETTEWLAREICMNQLGAHSSAFGCRLIGIDLAAGAGARARRPRRPPEASALH